MFHPCIVLSPFITKSQNRSNGIVGKSEAVEAKAMLTVTVIDKVYDPLYDSIQNN